jgi:MarR family transcriptional regulator for hemolysin
MERLGRQLYLTHKQAHDQLDGHLSAMGGSISEWVVLKILAEEPGLPHHQLAARMELSRPTLSHHLDRMEADGYLTRTRDTSDRRVVRVDLTAEGKQHLVELNTVVDAFDHQLRGLLPAREVETLQRLLTKLHQRLVHEGGLRAR